MASRARGRCINCSLLIPSNNEHHTLAEVTESILEVLRLWIMPTPILPDSIVCNECFELLQNISTKSANEENSEVKPVFGHRSVCYGCGVSILRAKTSRVPLHCPERNIILQWMHPHHVPRLEKVCRACWAAAYREVRRQVHHDLNRPTEALPANPAIKFEEDTKEISVGSVIPTPPPPLPRPSQLVSGTRDTAKVTIQAIKFEEDTKEISVGSVIPTPPPPPLPRLSQLVSGTRDTAKVTIQTYKRVASGSRHCVYVGCKNPERLLVPAVVKELVLLHFGIYIPLNARICKYHISNYHWDNLEAPYRDFTGVQIDDVMQIMQRAIHRSINFSNIRNMDPHLSLYWLGINAQQFEELLSYIQPELTEAIASVALSILLVKLRTGESDERLSSLFKLNRSTLERYMSRARSCMVKLFVPLYLGLNHTSITEVASRNKTIPESFFGNSNMPPEHKPAIVICDATYVYVQSSSNHLLKKKTYSMQKYTNLVKQLLFVCCDGYILECLGPYEATKNDSSIMSEVLSNETGVMQRFFRQNDIFILDRDFKDVIPEMETYGYKPHMPESSLGNQRQLTCEQANKSRFVTMCRRVVENINARVKKDYRLFSQIYYNCAAAHLMTDFRIACALLNKFHQPIEDSTDAHEYVQIAQSRMHLRNHLSEFIQREEINRRPATLFQNIDSSSPHLNSFPKLSMEELRRFALGSYELKKARSCFGQHVRASGTNIIEISTTIEDDLPLTLGINHYLIRGRIRSRRVSSRTRFTYILINRDAALINTLAAIAGYYCSCLVGNRTVGCCTHVMTVAWYLSWGRFNYVDRETNESGSHD